MLEENKESIANKIHSIFNFDQSIGDGPAPSSIVPILSAYEDKTYQLSRINNEEIKSIEDREYLGIVFKHMILIGSRALEKLEQNIKIGSRVGEGEDFAAVFKSLTECVSKLVDLRIKLFDLDNIMNPPTPPQNIQNNIFNFEGSSSEISDKLEEMMRNSREKSQLNSVEAKFDIGIEKP